MTCAEKGYCDCEQFDQYQQIGLQLMEEFLDSVRTKMKEFNMGESDMLAFTYKLAALMCMQIHLKMHGKPH